MAYSDKNINIQLDVAAQPATSSADKTQQYLASRLREIQRRKRFDAESTFNLYVRTSPRTFVEMIDWIKNGKFEIDKRAQRTYNAALEDADGDASKIEWYYESDYGINWTGAPKNDYAGYEAFIKLMNAEAQKVKDIINVMPAEQGLAALQAFEAWEPTGQAN